MEMLENGGYDNKKLNENADKLIRHELWKSIKNSKIKTKCYLPCL